MTNLITISLRLLIAASLLWGPPLLAGSAWRISDQGVAGIVADTPFDPHELRKLFPGEIVTATTGSSEGETYPILLIGSPKSPRLTVIPTVVGSISGVIAHAGPPIGTRFVDLRNDDAATDCEPGMEENSGFVFCRKADSDRVYYRFSGDYQGPDGELPPTNVLSDWVVDQVLWKAPQ